MNYPVAVAVLSLYLALPAESQAQVTAPDTAAVRRQLVGCYALFDSSGRAAARTLYWAPALARLDSNGYAVKLTPPPDAEPATHRALTYHWRLTPTADSVEILFHTGLSGTRFRFAVPARADTLRGHARQLWDFGPPGETDGGPATAVRISCAP